MIQQIIKDLEEVGHRVVARAWFPGLPDDDAVDLAQGGSEPSSPTIAGQDDHPFYRFAA